MKIRRRWRDYEWMGPTAKIAIWVGMLWCYFGLVVGVYYVRGESAALRDGDLVLYERWRGDYGAEDVILAEGRGGVMLKNMAELNGEKVHGRVLCLLRVRGMANE